MPKTGALLMTPERLAQFQRIVTYEETPLYWQLRDIISEFLDALAIVTSERDGALKLLSRSNAIAANTQVRADRLAQQLTEVEEATCEFCHQRTGGGAMHVCPICWNSANNDTWQRKAKQAEARLAALRDKLRALKGRPVDASYVEWVDIDEVHALLVDLETGSGSK